jgi:hypothetical protein
MFNLSSWFVVADIRGKFSMNTTNTPTFFISSTIYDFRDLRSALKFYLEEQGFKILASEFNDFQKPLDRHSYDACLDAIRGADYFVLLIGTRVGGWFDEANQVSITQREYQEAYRLHQAGKLKLLNFVRSEVWQVKEDRHALAKFLEAMELDNEMRDSIVNYKSKSASNAAFLMKFINEVGKNKETSLAAKGGTLPPTGNWIHLFSGFRDIVDVLNAQVFASVPVADMLAKRLLRRELRDVLRQCLLKFKNKAYSPSFWIDRFHQNHPLTLEGRSDEFTSVDTPSWDLISTVSMQLLGNRQLHLVVLPQVLAKPTFLEFELASSSFRETPVQNALVRLQDEVRRFNTSNTAETLSIIFAHSPVRRRLEQKMVEIETVKLAALLHLLDRWSNIVVLCSSLLKFLDGSAFSMPSLRPDTPVQGMQEMLEAETASDSDIDSYLASYS